eukprot:TRINITY_DN9492_c0_g1_i1.p1 TRINITY_DN9492_c0_g1~~TRINITY_DN9492_c0_g1_i1.p1  ORF type:complete len:286 (+),score=38.99 TRINITY_DN9492_c0_g1_i1:153-1010(+)
MTNINLTRETNFISLLHILFSSVNNRLKYEIKVTCRVISSNALISIAPGVGMSIISLLHHHHNAQDDYEYASLQHCILTALQSLLYFCLWIFLFDLGNQIIGVEEDKLNKPTRPIPSGFLSVCGAMKRYWISMFLLCRYGYFLGIFLYTMAWIATQAIYNYTSMSKHWFSKNIIFISVSIICQLSAAWLISSSSIPDVAQMWIFFLAFLECVTFLAQDMRDVEGDRKIGRNTLPVAIGIDYCRSALFCIFLVLCPFSLLFYLLTLRFLVAVCCAFFCSMWRGSGG